jgi:hypothetical protein
MVIGDRGEVPTGGNHRFGSLVDGSGDLSVVDSAEVSRRDCELCVTELARDHDRRDPLARHLHRVGVPQLMGRKPATALGRDRGVVQLFAEPRRRARPAACRCAQDTEQSSDRQRLTQLEPRLEA